MSLRPGTWLKASVAAALGLALAQLTACGDVATPTPSGSASSLAASVSVAAKAPASSTPSSAGAAGSVAAKPSAQASGSSNAAASAAPGTQLVRVAALQIVSDAGLYVAQDRGYFKQAGLTVNIQNFKNLGEQIPLLATNKLDVGGGGIDSGLFNAIGRGIPVKIVADKGSNLTPQFTSEAFVIRKDIWDSGKFKDAKDLKGMTIAVSALQNSVEELVDKALQGAELTLKNVTLKPLGFPETNTAMASKSIDAAVQLEPLLSVGLQQNLFVQWKNAYDIYPGQQVAVMLYGPDFAAKRDTAQKFMTAYVHGVRDYNDAFRKHKDYDQVVDILATNTSLKNKAQYATVHLSGLNPDGHVNAQGLTQDLAWYHQRDYVTADLKPDQIIDDSFASQAVKELGSYSG